MRIELGKIVMTNNIINELSDSEFATQVFESIEKCKKGDWGCTSRSNSEVNNEALKNNDRILALYETIKGKILIIIEWNRKYTTILFPHEVTSK